MQLKLWLSSTSILFLNKFYFFCRFLKKKIILMIIENFLLTLVGYGWNCFINGCIQSLLACPPIFDFLENFYIIIHRNDTNAESELKESLIRTFAVIGVYIRTKEKKYYQNNIHKNFYEKKKYCLHHKRFLKVLTDKSEDIQFSRCGDAKVVFLELIRIITEEVNFYNQRFYNQLPTVKTFDDLLVSTVTDETHCYNCQYHHSFSSRQQFFQIDSYHPRSIKEGIEMQLTYDNGNCKRCGSHLNSKLHLTKLSPIIMIEVQRERESPKFTFEKEFTTQNIKFRLWSITLSTSGHCTAIVRKIVNNQEYFVLFDDSRYTLYSDDLPHYFNPVKEGDRPYSRYMAFYQTEYLNLN